MRIHKSLITLFSLWFSSTGASLKLAETGPPISLSSVISMQVLERSPVREWIQRLTSHRDGPPLKNWDRQKALRKKILQLIVEQGLPEQMIAVAIVESQLQHETRSHRGAVGYWQLMPETARSLGLQVDRKIDERLDPEKSTVVAAIYLRRLFDRFHSWPLALAAYNAGPTRVAKALLKTGADDYWDESLLAILPLETRCFVPRVLATMVLLRDRETPMLEVRQNSTKRLGIAPFIQNAPI